MWALLWLQMISGQQIETFHIGNYDTQQRCSEYKESAQVMVTHSGVAVICVNLTQYNEE